LGQEDEKPTLITETCFSDELSSFASSINSDGVQKINILDWHACNNRQTSYLADDVVPKESFIERDRQVEKKVGAVFHPSVTMNGKTFRGDYSDPN